MATTLTKILIHFIFSTKNRHPLITPEIEPRLHAYISGIANNLLQSHSIPTSIRSRELSMNRSAIAQIIATAITLFAASPIVRAQQPSVPVQLSLASPKDTTFIFGKVTQTTFKLTNASNHAIVVTRFGDELPLSTSVYGSITKSETANEYRYSSLTQMASVEALHRGFLLPGESMEVTDPWRPEDRTQEVILGYRMAADPYDGTSTSLAPFNVFIPDRSSDFTQTYIPFSEELWKKAQILPGQESIQDGKVERRGPPDRRVIIPGLHDADQTITIPLSVVFEKPAFERSSASAAARRIAGDVRPLAYSEALGGYAVFERTHTWLLHDSNQRDQGPPLALFPARLLLDADKDGTIQVQISIQQPTSQPNSRPPLTGEQFWNKYPVEAGDGMYTRGRFITIAKSDLAEFLRRASDEKMTLERHNYFFLAHYYMLIQDANSRDVLPVPSVKP